MNATDLMTKEETFFIRSVFGKHYATALVAQLAKKKMLNQENEPFSASHIRGIVTGHKENLAVQMEILRFAKLQAKKKAKIAKERAAITKHIKL